MKNINKTIQVRLSEGESRMFNDLCSRFSCGVTELVKDWLRYNHKKTFPAYPTKQASSFTPVSQGVELTPEQICEQLGGTVVKDSAGNPKARFPRGTTFVMVPLSLMGKLGEAGDYRIKK